MREVSSHVSLNDRFMHLYQTPSPTRTGLYLLYEIDSERCTRRIGKIRLKNEEKKKGKQRCREGSREIAWCNEKANRRTPDGTRLAELRTVYLSVEGSKPTLTPEGCLAGRCPWLFSLSSDDTRQALHSVSYGVALHRGGADGKAQGGSRKDRAALQSLLADNSKLNLSGLFGSSACRRRTLCIIARPAEPEPARERR